MKAKDLFKSGGELSPKLRTTSDLIEHIRTKEEHACNYSIFLGAGASVTSGVRSAGELVEEWMKDIYTRDNGKSPESLGQAMEYLTSDHGSWYNAASPYSSLFEKKYDLPSQRRRFVEQEVEGKMPSIGYAYLTSLFDKGYFNTVFTTNFDDLINGAFYEFSNQRPIVCAHDSSINSVTITSKRPKIIKLHGDYLFDDIKSTLRETESLEQNTKRKLIEFCKEFGLILLGYAGNDRSIMDVLDFLAKQDAYLKNGIYWCFRPEDEINQNVRSLLWRDRVYPIMVDGFDEFLAQCHSNLVKDGLELDSTSMQTKRHQAIKQLMDDDYGLAKNELIAAEIALAKKRKNRQDISALLSDLTSENSNIVESDLRNLLEVDGKFKKNDYQAAKKLCEKFYFEADTEHAKAQYASKLVNISANNGEPVEALRWSDLLIECDPKNLGYRLRKARNLPKTEKKMEFLASLKNEFSNRGDVYNEYVSTGMLHYSNLKCRPTAELISLIGDTSTSLRLHPSLGNEAWALRMSLYSDLREDDAPGYKELMEKLIQEAEAINPDHIRTWELKVTKAVEFKEPQEMDKILDGLYKLYSNSSKSVMKELDNLLADVVAKIPESKDYPNVAETSKAFFEDHLKDSEIKDNPSLLLRKAEYYIGIKRRNSTAKDYLDLALECKGVNMLLPKALSISRALDRHSFDKIVTLLGDEPNGLTDQYFYQVKSEINETLGEYGKAIDYMRKAFSEGLDRSSFLVALTFLLLLQKKYQDVIDLRVNYPDEFAEDKEGALTVNFQFAAEKMNDKSFRKLELRNLAGSKLAGEGAKICAFSILGQEVDAIREIKKMIGTNFSNYYDIRRWPIICDALLEKAVCSSNVQAGSAKSANQN